MNIVLVCLNNIQNYIFDNINQLLNLKHENIYVIITRNLNTYFEAYSDKIKLIIGDDLYDSNDYLNKTNLNKIFRNGFWVLTSLRLFYINEFMKKYNIKDVIHIENDVLLYYNCNNIINLFNKQYVYMPFDCYNRNILSIMYIPSFEIFENVLKYYDVNKNDMENFVHIKNKTNLIESFPIFPIIENLTNVDNEVKFVSKNFDIFGYVFDAAAIGQYLGGVDPTLIAGNTVGFVNETCIIKYNQYNFEWKIVDNLKKPFLKINNVDYPIFNLHMHSKNLIKFI